MVGEHLAAQPASPPQPPSPQQQQPASPHQGEHPVVPPAIKKQRDIKTHLIQDIIEQHVGIHDNSAPSTDIKNIYRSFSEVYIDGHHLSFNNVDELDIWDLTSVHRAAKPEFYLGHTHLIHSIAHGTDINQTLYIVLTTAEHQVLLNHNVLTVDTSVIPADSAGMYKKIHLFQQATSAINYVVTRSAVVESSDPSHLLLVAV